MQVLLPCNNILTLSIFCFASFYIAYIYCQTLHVLMQLDKLIFKLRDKLNEIGIDQYDDRLAYRDLEDAYDTLQMIGDMLAVDITDYTAFPTYKVERCTIRVATYHAYRNYTRLAERQLGALPQGAPITISYDTIDAQNCLTLLFGVTFNEELIPEIIQINVNPVTSGSMGPSILDY
jgi:hypothetical protein